MVRNAEFGLANTLNILKLAVIFWQTERDNHFHFNILAVVLKLTTGAFATTPSLARLLSAFVSRSRTFQSILAIGLHRTWFFAWLSVLYALLYGYLGRLLLFLLLGLSLYQALLLALVVLLVEFVWWHWGIMLDRRWGDTD
jgi:hypothetical protein